MLYGNEIIQKEILNQVKKFETKYNKRVIFGAMVGSISKGAERYDSDYDTRFLYLDEGEHEFVRWDRLDDIEENQIHYCYIPEKRDRHVAGDIYRNQYREFELEDKSLFYDKIAFWELTSFVNFLRKPELDHQFSLGLYHIVAWTFNSPYCWDPYGIKSKISSLIDQMFVSEYEIAYYRQYICNALNKSSMRVREYLYSVYYALAIEYCMKYNRFAPVYFKSLFVLCKDEKLRHAILKLEESYYNSVAEQMEAGKKYERKMANLFCINRNEIIDHFLEKVLEKTEGKNPNSYREKGEDCIDGIIEIIFNSLERPIVKGVND